MRYNGFGVAHSWGIPCRCSSLLLLKSKEAWPRPACPRDCTRDLGQTLVSRFPMPKSVGDNCNLMDDAVPLAGQYDAGRKLAPNFRLVVTVTLQGLADFVKLALGRSVMTAEHVRLHACRQKSQQDLAGADPW